MHWGRTLNIVGCHAEGEIGDVITGGLLDVPGKTMFDKMMYYWTERDHIRKLLLNEPHGKPSRNVNIVLPPCDPRADAGFLIMESEEYAPMSGSNTICTATVLLETGMIEMKEPVTTINLDTAAGLVTVNADCEGGKCKAVSFDNVPAFVFELDYEVDVPGVGKILCDIAWGGMLYALVDIRQIPGLELKPENGRKIVEYGEKIKRAVQAVTDPVHPENPGIHGVTNFVFTLPIGEDDKGKVAQNTVVVSPGRLDRSPCGTGSCARMAVLHARGQLAVGEKWRHTSISGGEFQCVIRGTTKVGGYPAVLPTVKGRGWVTGVHQVMLDSSDPFPEGFRIGDLWHSV